jgi:hypothetical protein
VCPGDSFLQALESILAARLGSRNYPTHGLATFLGVQATAGGPYQGYLDLLRGDFQLQAYPESGITDLHSPPTSRQATYELQTSRLGGRQRKGGGLLSISHPLNAPPQAVGFAKGDSIQEPKRCDTGGGWRVIFQQAAASIPVVHCTTCQAHTLQ